MTYNKKPSADFHSLYKHGFLRVGAAHTEIKIADPKHNAEKICHLAQRAHQNGAGLLVLPELSLSGYAIDDLLQQYTLLEDVIAALEKIRKSSADLLPLIIVGAPIMHANQLFNCAVVIHKGKYLGVLPKSYLPNNREFYEKRHFSQWNISSHSPQITLNKTSVPFGSNLVFNSTDYKGFVLGVEICEDLWAPIPPSSIAALNGATIIVNLSASNATLTKAQKRRILCQSQSARCIAGYIYTTAAPGESTTDLAWDGHILMYENGTLLKESKRFLREDVLEFSDIDLELLEAERIRSTAFGDCASNNTQKYNKIDFTLNAPLSDFGLKRTIEKFPFIPTNLQKLEDCCNEAYSIQIQGLVQRLISSKIKSIVIGVSGGLDSAHALLIAAQAFDYLNLERSDIHAYTLPAFATSKETLSDAWALMHSLGVSAKEVNMSKACNQMLLDIGRPVFSPDNSKYDITFENIQAGARTSFLFRAANQQKALVLGTGDLSELALGWCTYGVGDHMSHYNINCSVPKTLMQHLIRYAISCDKFGPKTSKVLKSIVDRDITPELIPESQGQEAQKTEKSIGPYELQDFNLYFVTCYGFRPSKIAFLANHAWVKCEKNPTYSFQDIHKWLRLFLEKFFTNTQFKRSAMPSGPKIIAGVSLSPRGDWRAPSDCNADIWTSQLDTIFDQNIAPKH